MFHLFHTRLRVGTIHQLSVISPVRDDKMEHLSCDDKKVCLKNLGFNIRENESNK